MSKDYGTEFEIRQELEKLTTKEVIQKLKLWLYRPTEDIGIINTEQLMLERIEQELEVLEILKRIVKIVDCSKHPTTSPDDQLVILSGGEIKDVKEFDKIKEWLENDK